MLLQVVISQLVILLLAFGSVSCSWADRHPVFRRCVQDCEKNESMCGALLSARSQVTKAIDTTFGWTCSDECKHQCMWNLTSVIQKREGIVPKFFGRWPLIRFFGMLEPASSLASFAAFVFSVLGFQWLQHHRHPFSPYRWCYNTMFIVNCFTWLSSTLFHIRDLFILERMDYYGAFVSVFIPLFWYVCRNLYTEYRKTFFFTLILVGFSFAADVLYMETVKFDYTLHHAICASIVALGFGLWLIWVIRNFKSIPHSKYYLITFTCFATGPLIAKLFEWEPPLRWTVDAHSIFHILTAPTPFMFWWTLAVDDIYLNQEKQKTV